MKPGLSDLVELTAKEQDQLIIEPSRTKSPLGHGTLWGVGNSKRYQDPMVRQLAELLADIDPCGLVDLGAPRDEYDPEALSLVRGRQPVDIRRAQEVFLDLFGEWGALSDDTAEQVARAARSLDLPPTRPRLWEVQKTIWTLQLRWCFWRTGLLQKMENRVFRGKRLWGKKK